MNNEQKKLEKTMIEDWVKKNKPVRYQHGQRPEGEEAPTASSWRKRRRRTKAEVQAMRDAGQQES